MKAVSSQTMRDLDARTIRSGRRSGMDLMHAAGHAVTEEVLRLAAALPHRVRRIGILAGRGNNGGDGFVVARDLVERGYEVSLFRVGEECELRGDARTAYDEMPAALRAAVLRSPDPDMLADCQILVDALLGTGISGALRNPFSMWIDAVNSSGLPVIAVDVPSGLNADDGTACDGAVTADRTVTFALPKLGLIECDGPRYCGRITVANIGIPSDFIHEISSFKEVTDQNDVRRILRREPFDTFKNRRGHALIVGGSADYPSAPFLSAEAALRAGAGLVTVVIPETADIVCSVPKSLIVRRVPGTPGGTFSRASIPLLTELLSGKTAVAVGPGMTDRDDAGAVLSDVLPLINVPCVMDADALNLTARHPEWLPVIRRISPVLTPHEGEMARLAALTADRHNDGSRRERACRLARTANAVAVLKGVRTVIASPDGETAVNLSGCPALATAGSGDVLTGIVAAYLAAGIAPFDAARAAVYVHGLAGELASPLGGPGVIADDLPAFIPAARRCIQPV